MAGISESVDARLARMEAPVKSEYCRRSTSRVPLPGGEATTDALQLSAPATATERAQHRHPGADLCYTFARGNCTHGVTCKFNHDVKAFLEHKGPDLPGECPFSAADECPYGILCRWASKHRNPDPLIKEFVLPVAPTPDSDTTATTTAVATTEEAPQTDAPADTTNSNTGTTAEEPAWFWRGDGTVPSSVSLHPGASIQPTLNVSEKFLQIKLRKNQYDYSKTGAVLKELGIRNTVEQRTKRSADARQENAKKPRVETETAAPVAPAAASVDAVAAAVVGVKGDDASFLASITTAPEPAAETLPAPAPEPAAVATVPIGGIIDTSPAPRERHRRHSIDFRGKTFLAPLTTVGNLPFRRLCKGLGADVTCGEMAVATNLLQGLPAEWALMKRHPDEDYFGVQVCGGFGDSMAACAQLIEDTCKVDFVDVNFGCPIDLIVNKGAGSACLTKPQRMQEIVRSMSSVLSCPLTLKMRKGFNDGQDVAHTLIPNVATWGAAAVTLHGRTREQRYSRAADWDYIKRCADVANQAGIQVVGNGDVMSWQDHERAVNDAAVATTYVARGALIKPWIFTEIKERRDWDISAGERLDILKRYVSHGLEHWGSDTRGVENCRRFLLEWLSFTHRYIPVGLLEAVPQRIGWRAPTFVGRSDLETLLSSPDPRDWIRISEMMLGPAPAGFVFNPKHKSNSYAAGGGRDGGNAPSGAAEQENG